MNEVKVMIARALLIQACADEIEAEGFAEDCASAVDEATRLIALVQRKVSDEYLTKRTVPRYLSFQETR